LDSQDTTLHGIRNEQPVVDVAPDLAFLLALLRAGKQLTSLEAFHLARQVDDLLIRHENMRGLCDKYSSSLTRISLTVGEEVLQLRRGA
jgi:hypothetical protein